MTRRKACIVTGSGMAGILAVGVAAVPALDGADAGRGIVATCAVVLTLGAVVALRVLRGES